MSLTPTNDYQLVDAAGTRHEVAAANARIVSLVPSITELLFDLGLADRIVGRTGFCVEPHELVKKVPKVGGTKTIDVGRVKRLAPTHLVVNIDENPHGLVRELARVVPHVIVTHPCAPQDNVALFRLLGGIFGREERAEALCARFERALDETRTASAAWRHERVLYLIWKSPWMTVSRDTYIARMLATVGWDHVTLAREARYPVVDLVPEVLARTDVVLLSTEPYSFRERHVQELRTSLPRGFVPKVALIDGAMVSWYGSRAIDGLAYLVQFRQRLR